MSRKPTRKRKKKPRTKTTTALKQPSAPSDTIVAKSQTQFWTILGVALGLISLITLIELFPRPTASYSPPTDPARLLSSRFTISNDGYLRLSDVFAICYIETGHVVGGATILGSAIRAVSPGNATLSPGDALTVPCESPGMALTSNPVRDADLAIVASYRPWPFTFIRRRKFFRFVSRRNGETISWDRQPVSVLEDHFNWLVTDNPTLSMFK